MHFIYELHSKDVSDYLEFMFFIIAFFLPLFLDSQIQDFVSGCSFSAPCEENHFRRCRFSTYFVKLMFYFD